jgi:hypothetical protein
MSELKVASCFEFEKVLSGKSNKLFYAKSEVDKVIEDIIEGAISMFREANCCRGFDTKSTLGRIADVAFKHWNHVEHTMSNNRQLRLDKATLLRLNEDLRTRLNSEMSRRITDKLEYNLNIRHQKRKRCLAMARLCGKTVDHLNSEGYIYEKENHTKELTDCIRGTEFYDKWYHRWLALAEEPTWTKFLQLIHKEAK